MAESQVLIQVWARQHRLVEALDQFALTLEGLSEEICDRPSESIQNTPQQLLPYQKRLSKELKNFTDLFDNVTLAQWEIKPELEKIAAKAEEIRDYLFESPTSRTHEEWGAALSAQARKIYQLSEELKGIDLRSAATQEEGALFMDHADSLGLGQEIQWPRKIFHLVSALFIVLVYLFSRGSYYTKLAILGADTLYALFIDALRLTWPRLNAMAVQSFKQYMRKKEVDRPNSISYYLLSVFLVCWIFPKGIAVLAILFLGVGDPVASIVGIKWGRHKISNRFSLEGSLAFFAACFLMTLLYPQIVPSFQGNLFLFASLGGVIGMTSEWISDRLDDNFVIPLYSAFFLWLFVGRI